MQPVTGPRRDPAPSRWGYRLHRLWLTPVFRALTRIGLPVFVAVFAAGLWFSDESRRAALAASVAEAREAIESRPEFTVRMMVVDGADEALQRDIRAALAVDFPVTSFDLDLAAMREAVLALPAVESARLHVRAGGVLQVDVIPRVPVLVWRTREGLSLLDVTGTQIGPLASRADRPDLPLVAGEGADREVGEALRLAAAATPLAERLRGFVRVGERRWDVVLDRGQRILLPAEAPVRALDRAIALDAAQDLLARDISVVDLRNPRRPTIRLNDSAVGELRRIRSMQLGE